MPKTEFHEFQHEFMSRVLRKMGISSQMMRNIRSLYHDCRVYIVFANRQFEGFVIRSGIKQGCPLSALLFVIALDPFLRALQVVFLRVDLGVRR